MLRRRPPVRWIGFILCFSSLAISSGCAGGDRRAFDRINLLRVGMTQAEVREALGDGNISSDGGEEVWHYAYRSVPHPGKIAVESLKVVAIVALVVGVLALLMYSRSSPSWQEGGSWGDLGLTPGPVETGTWHFRVYFDREGKVKSISEVDLCEHR